MQRLVGVWTQTAIKNGSKGTVLCGDVNATWTGDEPGGQSMLERWASDLSFSDDIRKISQRIGVFMHARGEEGQPKTWIDHMLLKGGEDHIQLVAGYVSHSPLWEGISDHRPIWGIFKFCPAAQEVPREVETRKVRWELDHTDKRKCDGFVERMEDFEHSTPGPTEESTMEEVFEFMQMMQTHIAGTV